MNDLEKMQRMYFALKRIARYEPPERLRKHSEKAYGLPPEEAIEYAYENVIQEAKDAIKGMRQPVANMQAARRTEGA